MNKNKKETTSTEIEVVSDDIVTDKTIIAQDNQNFNLEKLISQGIDKGMTVDTLERLLAMRTQLKQEWAKEQFDRAMAKFQSECPTIKKTKEVIVNGKVVYSYAPIESVVTQVKSILEACGFSYSTNMEVLNEGVKVCVKVTHSAGHSQENCMQVPLGQKTGVMNASQQVAAAQTFAKRYAFLNSFGILTGDDDNDGANIESSPLVMKDGNADGGKIEYGNDGNIVEKPRQSVSASPKQLKFIEDLARNKGYSMIDIAEMQKKVLRTPTQLIDYLKGCPPKMKEELPVIEQGQDMTPEERALANSVPF